MNTIHGVLCLAGVLAVAVVARAQEIRPHDLVPLPTPVSPPAAISDLQIVTKTATTVTLSWTSPDDPDAPGVPATRYDLRYSLMDPTGFASDPQWFEAATPADGEPAPGRVGSGESMMVTGLTPSRDYFIAVTSIDGGTHWSGLSNIRSTATADPGSTSPSAPNGGGDSSGGNGGGPSCGSSTAGLKEDSQGRITLLLGSALSLVIVNLRRVSLLC